MLFIPGLRTATAGDNPRIIRASKIQTPPRIDGILDDAVWNDVQPAADFIQRDPEEGKPGSELSEVRVLYDDEALYFGCTFRDKEALGIIARLTRRDDEIESDFASIRIDSYHDHQTGYEFTFNAAGVKTDILQYDDATKEDASWDPVWELQTRITADGWFAEVKIPFRVVRYKSEEDTQSGQTWGVNFIRYISRKQETQLWAFTPKRETGFISRFGHLTGLRDLPDPRQLEILPFVVSRQAYEPASVVRHRQERLSGDLGVDVRYGLSKSFTLDATINPDFGQVEADPAVLNLSSFETFYPEKRPFFIEGTQIIRFSTFGGDFGPGMFYSRRIGRAIDLDEVNVPAGGVVEDYSQSTTILGAAKLSGKTNGGLSIGMLQAVTQREQATVVDSSGVRSDQVLEPLSHYNVVRMKQDILDNSYVGAIFTSTAKESRFPAFTNGWDWNLKLGQNKYSVDGFLAFSHSTNSQDERVTGSAGKFNVARIAAEHWLWTMSGDYTSKRYNINDVGFFFSPDDIGHVASLTYKEDAPAAVVRNYRITGSFHERWTFDGANLFRDLRMNGELLFSNYWRMTASSAWEMGLYDHRESRGMGLYRKPGNFQTSTYVFSDVRKNILFKVGQRFNWDTKNKRAFATEAGFEIRPLSWARWGIEGEYQKFENQEAWVTNIGNASIFGDRSTQQYNVILRSTVTFTRELTVQLYAQLFLAKGHYENFRQLVTPTDFTPYSFTENPDFNRTSLNTNLVLRWEYFPGSTLFLVWSQARFDRANNYYTSFGNDFNDTFQVPPANVLLMKISYWWSI